MRRKPPFGRCDRRWIPGRMRAEIILRQDGRCADCGTRLIMGFFVFDHRPPLALRAEDADANDPERLAAICWTCDQQKTPRDLKEITRNNRIARKNQAFWSASGKSSRGDPYPLPCNGASLSVLSVSRLGPRGRPS